MKKARLYITACGLYEAKLNGQRAGDVILAPGITDYRRRVQYQTYDVTPLLRSGENVLTVQLADGWYRGSTGAWGLRNQYGTETKLLAQLEITHTDGHVQTVCTDESWEWSNDGPIRFADNKDGEVVDAGCAPSYNGKAKATAHPVTPSASDNVAVREHERLHAQLLRTPAGKTVLDFGQNIAGYAAFTLTARAGQTVTLRFGEMLDENGEFTQKNIQLSRNKFTTPLQQVVYTCKDGANAYKTTFAIFGFRYVLVETKVPFKAENFTAIAVYSDMERTGWFESSNPLLDKFVENTVWSAKNNHADLPTDCPTRERHGWSGDAQIFCPTACFLFGYEPMAEKFLNDMYDWQRKSGCLPQIAPSGGTDFYMYTMNGSVGWADAGVIMPYVLWKQYGNKQILGDTEDISRFAEYRDGCRTAYQAMIKTEQFTLDTDRQARLVRPLALHLLDEAQTAYAKKRLLQALKNYGWRLGTGFLSTPLILDVLAETDLEAAYRLLENEQMPGWLFMPKSGATTIWESWEGDRAAGSGVASLNHYSKGAVCRWLFDTMCGIRVSGENCFSIAPRPGGHFTRAKAAYNSVYGRVESGWEKTENGWNYTVTIPVNCTAVLTLPGKEPVPLTAGTYTF